MRQRLVPALPLALVLLVAGFVLAAPVGAKNPGKDKANGTVQVAGAFTKQTITMFAQSGPNGENATGSLTIVVEDIVEFGTTSASGVVDHLIVDGTRATACGTITSSNDPNGFQ